MRPPNACDLSSDASGVTPVIDRVQPVRHHHVRIVWGLRLTTSFTLKRPCHIFGSNISFPLPSLVAVFPLVLFQLLLRHFVAALKVDGKKNTAALATLREILKKVCAD